jgi:uncharacterized membrane protein YdjX (TVP38/TMEM64 family)
VTNRNIMLEFFKKNTFSIVYAFFLGLMPLLVSSSITYWVAFHEAQIQAFSWQNWAVIYLMACFTMSFAMTPTTFVALLSGYFLGWSAIIPVCLSYWVASIIGFKVAEKIDGGRFLQILTEKPEVKKVMNNLQKQEFKIILLARLSPVLPFAVSNLIFSFSRANLRNFMTAGFIGMLPRTLLSLWLGTQAKEVKMLLEHPSEGSFTQLLIIGLIVVSVYGLFILVKRAIDSSKQ